LDLEKTPKAASTNLKVMNSGFQKLNNLKELILIGISIKSSTDIIVASLMKSLQVFKLKDM